jgi:hypothetical protein
VLPGLAGAVGLGAAAVGAAVVGAAVGGPFAVGAAVVGAAVGWVLGLGLERGRTTRSGPQALTTTTAMATKRAP